MKPQKELILKKIVQTIGGVLKRGISVPFSTRLFLESSVPDFFKTGEVLGDEISSDIYPALDLVFTPCKQTRYLVEPLFWQYQITALDESKVRFDLEKRFEMSGVYIKSEDDVILVRASEFTGRYVSRLKMTRHLPGEIKNSLIDKFGERCAMEFSIRIRLAGTLDSPGKVKFVSDLICNAPSDKKKFGKALDLLLVFFRGSFQGNDFRRELESFRNNLIFSLNRIASFARQMEKDNIETLMMRGVVIPCMEPVALEEQFSIAEWILHNCEPAY